MSWSLWELRYNASVLYNYLCSEDADKVYVDGNGYLQVDHRNKPLRHLMTLGDSSREAINEVAIKILEKVADALEKGTLDPKKIIVQKHVPLGSYILLNENDNEWIDRSVFATNVNNSSYFKANMPVGYGDEKDLSYEQKVCAKVIDLCMRIIIGKKR